MKVVKFGGTSMATADTIGQVVSIVNADKERRIVVVSAPGKRFKSDTKVTDLLYKAYAEKKEKGKVGAAFSEIRTRFTELVKELGLNFDITPYLDKVEEGINASDSPDYAASRGEYLSAVVTSEKLGFEFVDAADIIRFKDGVYDAEGTAELMKKIFPLKKNIVVPGFYGSEADGKIVTFSRGGSDVTGAIMAAFAGASIYENWTDVSGFMTADPRIVENPVAMKELSYEELRELSYMGASVLHPESIFPVKVAGIPINIRNTFAPDDAGTMIVKDRSDDNERTVTGIAGHSGNTTIVIEKSMMNNEIGFVRKILTVLEERGVSFEHMPTGIDTMSLVIPDAQLKDGAEVLIEEIKKAVNPDRIYAVRNLSLIAVVGKGMAKKVGTSGKIFGALSAADVNIRMIDQGSSEMNIIVGVEERDYEKAINAVYNVFFS